MNTKCCLVQSSRGINSSPARRCSRPQLCPLQSAFLPGWVGRLKDQVLLPVFSQPLQGARLLHGLPAG